jgi:hypothetical protein
MASGRLVCFFQDAASSHSFVDRYVKISKLLNFYLQCTRDLVEYTAFLFRKVAYPWRDSTRRDVRCRVLLIIFLQSLRDLTNLAPVPLRLRRINSESVNSVSICKITFHLQREHLGVRTPIPPVGIELGMRRVVHALHRVQLFVMCLTP